MDYLRGDLGKVKQILAGAPRGMTIIEVSEQIGVNRNSVAKYLEVLRTAGEVEMRTFGRSRIYSLSHRMPLATALSLSSELIVMIDGNLQVLDANDQFLRFAGITRGDITGQSLGNLRVDILAHPNILLNVKDALSGKEYSHEISVVRGREEHFFKIKLIPVSSSDIQRRTAIVFENITARKKAEIALRESEARYRAVVEDQTELICRMLPDTTITFVNDAWCRYFGTTPEYVLGKKHLDLIPPEYRAAYRRDLESIRSGKPTIMAESEIMMPGPKQCWLQMTCRGRFDGKGQLTEMQIVSRDITERRQAEEMLRKLSRAVEDSPAMVVITDIRGDIEYVNPKFTAVTGYAFEAVRGRNPRFLKTGHTTQDEYLQMWTTILSGREWRGEFLNRKKNGGLYWESAIISPIANPDGTITNFVAIKEDVTERRRADAALRESEARYRAVIESQTDMIVRMLPDTTITFVNAAVLERVTLTLPEIVGSKLMDILPQENLAGIRAKLDAISPAKESWSYEDCVTLRDRQPHWFQWTCRGIFDSGELREYQVVTREITGLKKAEIAMQESEEKFRAAFDQSPIGACLVSLDFRFLRVNPEFSRITGYQEDELQAMTFLEMTHPDDREADTRQARELVAGNIEQYHLEKRCICKDGRVIWLRKHARLVKDLRGKPLYFLPMFEDITEHKLMEEALKLNQFATDNAAGGVIWIDSAGRLIYANNAVVNKLNYSREELLRMNAWDINPTYDPEKWRQRYEESRKNCTLQYESVHRARDGTLIPVEILVSFLQYGDREYFCACVRDLSDRKRLTESLRIAQTSVDKAVDEFNRVDRDGRIRYVNEASCRKLGYSRDELLKLSVWDINPKFSPEKYRALMVELREKGYKQFESMHRTKDGKEYPVDVTLVYLPWGETEYVCAYDRDITDRIRADTALNQYRFTIDNVSDAVCWLRCDGTFVLVNDALCRMSGYSRDELLARDIFCVSSQVDRTEWPQRLERIKANEPLRVEMVGEFAGGKLIPVEFSMSMLAFGGNDYICVIGRPITEPERAARVMAARAVSFAKYPEKPAVP